MGFIAIIGLFVLYLLPAFIANYRKTGNENSVFVINAFLGWTLIGWVVSLAMAVAGRKPKAA